MKKNLTQTLISYVISSIGIGAIAITTAMLISFGMNEIIKQIVVWLAASALIGIASMIYENERMSDLTATLIHAPITCIIALLSGWILNYGDGSFTLLISRMLPTIVVLYLVIHLVLFLFRRAAVTDVNSRLQKK